NFVSHGISRVQGAEDQEGADHAAQDEAAEEGGHSRPLESYATNLNEQARQGRIDPLIGREHEVERVVQILVRRRKNNPLLVGEA
ncbi:MAG TPA: ATP-dependent Clp protease ATP-binding subunit ClpA, partial [Marinobacter hydrocarbonoclasticus]|nr:ATP-dependent Clp protease ATP-binding subunit ClpA [Marinobacter nauticus]